MVIVGLDYRPSFQGIASRDQVHGMSPLQFNYVNASEDPRKK